MAVQRNTFGYRDAHKAMTLKALQDRAKEAHTSFASSGADPVTDPISGAASMLGVVNAGMGARRAEREEAEGRSSLARIMAGVKPQEANEQQLAEIGMYDPELAAALREERVGELTHEDTQAFTTSERLGTQAETQGSTRTRRAKPRGSTRTPKPRAAPHGRNTRRDEQDDGGDACRDAATSAGSWPASRRRRRSGKASCPPRAATPRSCRTGARASSTTRPSRTSTTRLSSSAARTPSPPRASGHADAGCGKRLHQEGRTGRRRAPRQGCRGRQQREVLRLRHQAPRRTRQEHRYGQGR